MKQSDEVVNLGSGTIKRRLDDVGDNVVQLDGTGKIPADDLPSSGGSGSPATFSSSLNDGSFPDAGQQTLPADNSQHSLSLANSTPPDWSDADGNIITPGLYVLSVSASLNDHATDPTVYATVQLFNDSHRILLDSSSPFSGVSASEVIALAAGNLPYLPSISVSMPADDTATVHASAFITRLAFGGPT